MNDIDGIETYASKRLLCEVVRGVVLDGLYSCDHASFFVSYMFALDQAIPIWFGFFFLF